MSNGRACCILGVCCPPGSQAQLNDLTDELTDATGYSDEEMRSVAAYILQNYDLVPVGVGRAIVEHYGPEFAKVPPPGLEHKT